MTETMLTGQTMRRGPQHAAAASGKGNLVASQKLHVLVQHRLAEQMAVHHSAIIAPHM
jgi:hypothetical protein